MIKRELKTNTKIWNTAIYVRISKEDNNNNESASITNQISMISDFCNTKKEFNVVDTYIDDGYRGGSFDRPAFLSLQNDIESKKINCIIIKDLSRLGRDYLTVGRLVKYEFPKKNVRLISLGDSYDSEDSQDGLDINKIIMLPFKSMLAEAYSLDLSKKISSQLHTMRVKGEYVGAFAPYGYIRNNDTKKLEIDTNVSGIIKRIFDMKIDGYSNDKIATILNNENIQSPLKYKEEYTNFKTSFKKDDETVWNSTTIKRILENETYIGKLVQGKRTSKSYKNKSIIDVSENRWVVVENGVDSIISTEDFELVKKIMGMDTRIQKDGKIDVLSGLLYCSECGEKLNAKTFNTNGKKYSYYTCVNKFCKKTKISKIILQNDILNTLSNYIRVLFENFDSNDNLEKFFLKNEEIETLNKEYDNNVTKLEQYTSAYNELYINYNSRNLFSEDEYLFLKNELYREIEECKRILIIQENKIKDLEERYDKNKIIEKFEKHKNIEKLTRRTVVKFIDFITYSKDKGLEVTFNKI